MAPQKETFMKLTVDLECNRCYLKVKRILCSFPQVRDQTYKEKENAVMIKVVCCCPERIRDKLCAKGGKSIKSIEILEDKKPHVITPTGTAGGKTDKTVTFIGIDQPENPQAGSKSKKNVTLILDEHPAEAKKAPPAAGAPKPAERAAMMAPMVPASVYGYGYGYPVNVGCLDCYEGRMCGYHNNGFGYGYGFPPPPPPPAGGYGYGYKPGYCGDYVSGSLYCNLNSKGGII